MRNSVVQIFIAWAFFAQIMQCKAQDLVLQQIMNDVNLDSLVFNASAISGEFAVGIAGQNYTITSRNKNNPGNAQSAIYLHERLQGFGLSTTLQPFGTTGENVLATQPGMLNPGQKVILCGHYDSMPTGNVSPAADDDGSGTAAVLEAARILSQHSFAFTLVYAIWDEEEYGLSGSNYYATQAFNAGDTILAVINMDAIAYDGNGDGKARVHTRPIANSLSVAELATYMNATYSVGLDLVVNNPGATYSDHASFWNKGFTAVLMIEDFDNDGNPHYHTTTDRVEYFDLPYFHKLARLSIGMAASLAVPMTETEVAEPAINSFQAWYNPLNSQILVKCTSGGSLRLVDLTGRTALHQPKLAHMQAFDASHLNAGIYALTYELNGRIQSVKMAISH